MAKERDFPPDDELLERIRAGDEEAKYQFNKKHSKLVNRVVWGRLWGSWCNHQEDVRVEIWDRVFRGLLTMRDPSRLECFIRTVAIRESNRHLRNSHMNQPPTVTLEDAQGAERGRIASVEKTAEDAELLDKALAEVEAALPKSRKILILRLHCGHEFEEIGERVGEPTNKVRRIFYRGLTKLRKLLKGGSDPSGDRR